VVLLVNTELTLPLIHSTSGGGLPVTWQIRDKSSPSTTGLIVLIKTSGESEEETQTSHKVVMQFQNKEKYS